MDTHNKDSQAAMTPGTALRVLAEGNARFTRNQKANRNLLQQVTDTRNGQWPFAAVLSCIDSRVPAEAVFDQGVGDMFSVRIAGNFVNVDILGSLEFSCKVAGAKLIVVLGHSHCGAVRGACDKVELGNLTHLLKSIQPAIDATPEPADPRLRNSGNPAFIQDVSDKNVDLTVQAILDGSPVLREMQSAGEIAIIGGMYDVETGQVTFAETGV